MNTIEDRLRDELQAVAGRVQADALRPLRPPARRRRDSAVRWLAPVAAMAAVAGIVTAVTLTVQPGGRQPTPSAAQGGPRFYVILQGWAYLPPPSVHRTYPYGITAYVRSATTGRILSSIVVRTWAGKWNPPPGARKSPSGLNSTISAAADESVFALTVPGGEYLLHVSPSGRSVQLNLVILPDNSPMADAAISPDGGSIVYNYQSCRPHEGCRYGVAVLSLTTGHVKVWLAPVDSTDGLFQPVFAENGKQVVIFYSGRFRLLDVAGPGGSLAADSRPIYTPIVDDYPTGSLTPDGRAFLVAQMRNVPAGTDAGTAVCRIVEVSARTGRPLRALLTTRIRYSGTPFSSLGPDCYLISVGPAGLHALVRCPSFGRLDGDKFTSLPGIPTARRPETMAEVEADMSWAVAW